MRLKIKESENRERIPLAAITDISQALNSILKESYRNLAGIRPGGRVPEFTVFATNFENGSFITDLAIEISNITNDPKQTSFIIGNFSSEQIFTVAKGALEFWKKLANRQPNEHPLSVTTSPNSFALINTGSGSITVGDVIISTASAIPRFGNRMLAPLRSGDVSQIELGGTDESPLLLETKDADCFSTPTEIDLSVKEQVGDLIEFNKRSRTGVFAYLEGQYLVSRSFTLNDDTGVIEAIDSMKRNRCRMFFHERFIRLPGDRRAVVKLQAIKIEML